MFNPRHAELIRTTLPQHARSERHDRFITAVSRLLDNQHNTGASKKRQRKDRPHEESKGVVEGAEDLGEAMPSHFSSNSQQRMTCQSPIADEVAAALVHTEPLSEEPLPAVASPAVVQSEGSSRSEVRVQGATEKRPRREAVRDSQPALPKDDIDDIFDRFG